MDFYSTLESKLGPALSESLRDSRNLPVMHGLYLNKAKLDEETLLSTFPCLKRHPIVPNAFYYQDGECEPGKHLFHHLGGYYLLDPASMLPPFALSPKPGERILDLCAAPGGKTCLMAMMEPSSILLSNDRSYSRSLITSQNVERLGLGNVAVTAGDFGKAKSHYQGYFDAILLDAPCSGSAMFRKDKRLEEDWSIEKVQRVCAVQIELLKTASFMLTSGGRIVYSTCSFSYEEDEAIILEFLRSHPDFKAVAIADSPCLYHHEDLPESVRALPHLFPGEGQFICLLVHQGEKVAHPKAKASNLDKVSLEILSKYGLSSWSGLRNGDTLYALPEPIDIQGLSLLRRGVKVGEFVKGRFEIDHALATTGHLPSISIDENLAKRFLQGEGFMLNAPDGEVSLRYLNFDLGYAKIVHGYAKNHYPKGLRRKF